MKKILSIIMTVFMLSGMISMLVLPTSAAEDAFSGESFKVYVSDTGDNANDGLTPEAPKKTLKASDGGALSVLRSNCGEMKTYQVGEIVLVGDLTISLDTQIDGHYEGNTGGYPVYDLIITSSDKNEHVLKLNKPLKLGGATMFTNIKVLTTATATVPIQIWANGHNIVMGKEGVVNDVITYDSSAGSVEPLTICGGVAYAPANKNSESMNEGARILNVNMTINSGTYKNINITNGTYGGWIVGDVNVVINDATLTDGDINIGGRYETNAGVGGICMIEGDVNLTINGGTFTYTNICVGYTKIVYQTNSYTFFPGSTYEFDVPAGSTDIYAKNVFLGDIVIDINGGTFSHSAIGKGSLLSNNSAMASSLIFVNPITVDISSIPLDARAQYLALVNTAEEGTEAGQIEVLKHSFTKHVYKDATNHTSSCECGCGLSEDNPHSWDEGVVTTKQNHSTEGVKTYTCVDCGGTRTEAIPMGHCLDAYDKTTDTHTLVCSDPNCPDANKAAGAAESHAFNEAKITKEATHTEDGEKISVCTVCGYEKIEVIEKNSNNHSLSEEWVKHDENQHKKTCECGFEKYQDHEWGTPVPEGNEKVYTCTVCGEKKGETVTVEAPATEKGGCFSTVGVGILAVALGGAAFALLPKKKED